MRYQITPYSKIEWEPKPLHSSQEEWVANSHITASSSFLVIARTRWLKLELAIAVDNRNGGTRTPDTWFIRPPLSPLSYVPQAHRMKNLVLKLFGVVSHYPTVCMTSLSVLMPPRISRMSWTLYGCDTYILVIGYTDCIDLARLPVSSYAQLCYPRFHNFFASTNTTSENRTRISALKGLCPYRLDDGGGRGA